MSFWTPERIDLLKALWAEGRKTRAIGKELGCTRYAVIGRAHRLNLPGRKSPLRPASPKTEMPRVLKPGQPTLAPAFLVTQPPKGWDCPLLVAVAPPTVRPLTPPPAPAARTCQFIEGDPRGLGFCGEVAVRGSSYCAKCHARCYRPVSPSLRFQGEAA